MLGVAEASIYFVEEKNIRVEINYTSYYTSGAALALIFDNETWREYFRDRLMEYVKEVCSNIEEPKGVSAIKFKGDVEPRVNFIKGENWSRVSISFNMTGEGEPVLGRAGEYWAHYEFRGGFLQLIRGGVLQWLMIVRPPLPLVLIDVLTLNVTLPRGYSAVQVVPKQSSAFIDWKEDRVVLIWLFRDPSIERRDPAVAGIQSLYLDIKSLGEDERRYLNKLEELEKELRRNLPYSLNRKQALSLLNRVSLARYEERVFQTLTESYLEGLILEAEGFLRKVLLFKLMIGGLPVISALISYLILVRGKSLGPLRKLFKRAPLDLKV